MKKFALLFIPLLLVGCSKNPSANSIVDEKQEDKISHVILLAGGENCLGYSYSYHLEELDGVSDEKFNEYKKGYENVKISFKNMLNSGLIHKEQTSFVNTRIGQGKAAEEGIQYGCLGPEVGIAEYLSNVKPNDTYYIIKFAGGGESSFVYQWNNSHGTYFTKMTEFFDNQLNKLKASGVDFDVSSFMFVQGETDAKNANPEYKRYFEDFVNDIKLRYYSYAPKNGMSFIDAGISSYYMLNYRNINSAKKEVMSSDSRNFYIDTISANITRNQDNMDRIHYDAKGEIKLGNLFAKAFLALQDKEITGENYSPNEQINKPSLDSNYVVDSIRDGKLTKAYYSFNSDQVIADVIDENMLAKDGISIKHCLAESEEFINPSNLKKFNIYLDGKTERFDYSVEKKEFEKIFDDTSYLESVSGIKGDDDNLIGYRIVANIPNPDDECLFISFGTIQNGSTNYYRDGFIVNNDPETYPYISGRNLMTNRNVLNGSFFGSASNLKVTKGWDLSVDDEYIVVSNGRALNTVYAHQKSDNTLRFAASITALNVINYDLYPKFGIILADEENNGVFYYVDSNGSGYTLSGTTLGYCKVTGGVFSDYVSLGYNVGSDSSVYTNGNYISLGIDRQEDEYSFLFNGVVIQTINNVANIGLRNAYFGINTFNVAVNVKNYELN